MWKLVALMVLIFPKLQAEEPSFLSLPPALSHFSPTTLPQNLLHISLQHYYLGDKVKLPKYLFHQSFVRVHAADLPCTYICRKTVIDPPKFEKCYLACFKILFRDFRIQVHPTVDAVKAGRKRVDTGLKPQVLGCRQRWECQKGVRSRWPAFFCLLEVYPMHHS